MNQLKEETNKLNLGKTQLTLKFILIMILKTPIPTLIKLVLSNHIKEKTTTLKIKNMIV